jgi:hypothetical protein
LLTGSLERIFPKDIMMDYLKIGLVSLQLVQDFRQQASDNQQPQTIKISMMAP